jgi:hypothetical protein
MFRRRLRDALLLAAAALSGLLAASAGSAAEPAAKREASIPFAADRGIRDWQADGSQGLWVQANSGAWYYGKFSFPCTGLQFQEGLKFKFNPDGSFDRWSAVLPRDQGRCLFTSFEPSAGPPKPVKKQAPAVASPAAPSPTPSNGN